jgi:hypothetical protein
MKNVHSRLSTFQWIAALLLLGSPPDTSGTGNTGGSGPLRGELWAPVARPERLALVSWNSPVTATPSEAPAPAPAPEGTGPVSISLSDPIIGNEFFGIIDLTIDGLSAGQSVVLEKFRVDNDQGVVNGNALLQESHRLTDGVAAAVGETFNWNRLYDVSERNGSIRGELDFWEPSAASIPGEYVYRVSSPLGSFTPQAARLTVTNQPTAQNFAGTVSAGGQPVSGAIVALLDPLTGYADFLKGTFTDENGNYTLGAPHEDEFDIVALKPGYVGPLAVGTGWVIESGETVTANLQLQAGTRTISGTLRAGDTDEPLPGVEMIFISLNDANQFDHRLCAVAWTDSQGGYSVPVTADRWGVMVRVEAAAKAGFVTSSAAPLMVADARTADVPGTTTRLNRAGPVIWGRVLSGGLVNGSGNPVALGGIEVMALNDESEEWAWTVTDADGDYRVAVRPGRWRVFPFSFSLEDSAHSGGVQRELFLTTTNQSLRHDFVVRPAGGSQALSGFLEWLDDPNVTASGASPGGEIEGFIVDAGSNAIGRLRLLAFNADLDIREGAIQATHESDGYYNFHLPDGEWVVFPDPEQSADRSLLFKDLPRVTIVANSSIQSNVTAVAATSTIELTVTDSSAAPLSNLLVHAFANIGGSTYDSFGRSDATGVARLPAIPGAWVLHVKAESAGAHGKKELPFTGVNVTGATATVSLQAENYSNTPSMLSLARREDGALKFSGTGDSGRYYAIQASTNLADWYEIGRARAVTNSFNLVDGTTHRAGIFYRVAQD